MPAQPDNRANGERNNGALITCFVIFAIFFINVLFGKANISYGLNIPHMGNVAEFLLLFLACCSLIVAALKSEAAEK